MSLATWYFKQKKFKAPSPSDISSFLDEEGSAWYQALSDGGKEEFQRRCRKFIEDKRFLNEGGGKVEGKTKVQVASKAVQIGSGLSDHRFPRIHTIRLQDEAADSEQGTIAALENESFEGTVLITHPDRIEKTGSDELDLSLFEWAYVLKSHLDPLEDFQRRFSAYIEKWDQAGKAPHILTRGAEELLSGTTPSPRLWFALSLMSSFRDPKGLEEELPYVHYYFVSLLALDPAQKDGRLKKRMREKVRREEGRSPDPDRLGLAPEKKPGKLWMFFLGGGILGGTVANIILHNLSLMSWPLHFGVWGLIGLISGIVQFGPLVKEQEVMNKAQFWTYSLVGPGNLFLALLLGLNHLFSINQQEHLAPFARVDHARQGKFAIAVFPEEHKELNDGRIAAFNGDYFYSQDKKPNGLKVSIGRGVLGIPTVQKRELVHLEEFED